MQSSYTPLQPDYLTSLGVKSQDLFSATPALGVTTSLVATILFMFIGGAAFYRYGMAGLYRMESSDNGIRKSNEAMRGATLGILGIFIMFLFFFTFNRDMLRSDIGLSILNVGNVGSGSTKQTPVVTTEEAKNGAKKPLPTGACVRATCTADDLPRITGANDTRVRTELANVGVNAGACTQIGQSSCTNVGGLPDDVINMLKDLYSSCGRCKVIVSGGTEWWAHGSHGPGVSAVDLQIPRGANPENDLLYQFLLQQTNIGSSNACHVKITWKGWLFCDEKSGAYAQTTNRHWHVQKQ